MADMPSDPEPIAPSHAEPGTAETSEGIMQHESSTRPIPSFFDVPPTPSESSPKSCFICLETSNETAGEVWVTPCPCTLDAHERCMLQWIAETESSGGRRKLRCPACNSRIRTTDPWDPVVELGERYDRFCRGSAPLILVSIFTTMGIAGSGYYGFQSMLFFAGVPNTMDWLGARRAITSVRQVPLWRWKHGMIFVWKFFLLNLIAPCLLLYKAIPSLMNLIALPASFVYGASLISKNSLPTWPPSPEWALALMPYVNIAYSNLYHDLFGTLERRLNKALRGISAVEGNFGDQQPANQEGGGARPQDEQREGILAALRRLRNTVANILRHDEEIVPENVGAEPGFADGQDLEFQLEIVMAGGNGEDENRQIPPVVDNERAFPRQVDEGGLAAQPADIQHRRPGAIAHDGIGDEDDNNRAAEIDGAGNNRNEMIADGNRALIVFSDILTTMATQLLLPRISSVAGDMLSIILPLSWVTKSPYRKPTSLLQEKWGRSLVGGCLFIVLRDALNLYTKYRRVQLLRHRRIKNIDRRSQRTTAASSAA